MNPESVSSPSPQVIAIVGSGFSGTLVAVNLARLSREVRPPGRPLREEWTLRAGHRLRHVLSTTPAQRPGGDDERPGR